MPEQALERTFGFMEAERMQALKQIGVTSGVVKVRLLLLIYNLSLRQVCDASHRAGLSISRSQFHRILRGQKPTAGERSAIAVGINECLRQRCDSAYLFGD